jgi:methylmalonyl-CoA mutase N-terminal domain/subunit
VALRTQQIIAHESGVANTVDPLGGSYCVEALTHRIERQVHDYFDRINDLGGVVPAIERGFFQREIAESAYRFQREIEQHERVEVGVNRYVDAEPVQIPLLKMDPEGERRQIARLQQVREERDSGAVAACLARLEGAARGDENLMPAILDAVRAYATLGEMCGVLRRVFGEYRERPVL